ncbi:unnamed protein product [Amoebophrya sp. A25]|nr:unnamed protein product [Amoebophrya sp. A25]|eukprot:GSA25T00012904001.1
MSPLVRRTLILLSGALCASARLLAVQEPPACANISCSPLQCPAGFEEKQEPGTCCPVCFNPNIKLESQPAGATGEHGGAESTFCKSTWCFPTLCPSEDKITAPTTENGQCCPVCDV